MLVNYLKKIPLFKHLKDAQLREIAARCKSAQYKKGDVIFYKTDLSTDLYIVNTGKLKAVLADDEGGEMVLARFEKGAFFGELSLLDDKGRSATIMAETDSELSVLKKDVFLEMVFKDPLIAVELMTTLVERLRKADEMIESLAFQEVGERLVRALVEGDATLLMQQWWQQYAGPQDYQDILRYRPPSQTLPEDYPPPYVSRDLDFPYLAGLSFVQALHKRGNWAEVNKAYTNPPASTEQILHPEKYVADEQPIAVAAPPLTETLGADWHMIDDDVLGEWTTYLILNAGADLAAQIDDAEALKASRGWGGDHYQVYYNAAISQTVLAAEWVWDTPRDATEFKAAMLKHLGERFRGAQIDREAGDCWESNQQTSCFFVTGDKTLWLLAPDMTTLEAALTQYPDFQ